MIESDAVDTSFFGLQHHWPNYRICPQQPSGEDYHACHADGVCEITECNIYVVGNMNFRVFHGTCSRPIAAEIRHWHKGFASMQILRQLMAFGSTEGKEELALKLLLKT